MNYLHENHCPVQNEPPIDIPFASIRQAYNLRQDQFHETLLSG